MIKVFEKELVKRKIVFTRVRGDWEERSRIVTKEIDDLFSKNLI
jgi:hypothetical protein